MREDGGAWPGSCRTSGRKQSMTRSGGSRLPWMLCLFFAASSGVLGYFAYAGGFGPKSAEAAGDANEQAAKAKSENCSTIL